MNTKITAITIAVMVLFSGCSMLGQPVEDSQTSTPTVMNGTVEQNVNNQTTTETTTIGETNVGQTTVSEATQTQTNATTETPNPTPTDTDTPTETSTPTETDTPTDTPTETSTPTETETETETTSGASHTLKVVAVDGGTSEYSARGVGSSAYPADDTENTDTIANAGSDGQFPTAEGITGDHSKDTYRIEYDYLEGFQNHGNATLEVYIDGELIVTLGPGEGYSTDGAMGVQTPTETTTEEETPTQSSTTTSTPTEATTEVTTTEVTTTEVTTTEETTTEETTTTQTTVNREEIQKVEVTALEEESTGYEFVASGPVTLGSETTSQAEASGSKGSGVVSEYGTDTYYIPEGEEVIEVSNTDGSAIGSSGAAIRVTVDGEEVDVSGGPGLDTSTFDSNSTITIKSVDGRSDYLVEGTGDFFATDDTDDESEAVYPDEINSESVTGSVGDGGTDSYKFTGRLTALENNGQSPLQVLVDGEQIATVESGGLIWEDEFNSST